MGLLKHGLLPALTLVDSAIAIIILVLQINDPDMLKLWNYTTEPLDDLTQHMLHASGGTFLLLAVNNVCSILHGNSFHRATALALHGVFVAVDAWSYLSLSRSIPGSIYVMSATVMIGLLVHSQEPGSITKDNKQQLQQTKANKKV